MISNNATPDLPIASTLGISEDTVPLVLMIIAVSVLFIIIIAAYIYFTKRASRPSIPKELKKRPIKTEYEPPVGLSPADTGTLFNAKIDAADILSIIIDLAVRGYLKIYYIPGEFSPFKKGKFVLSTKDYEFIKLKEGNDLSCAADVVMFNLLFGRGGQIKLSELRMNMTYPKDNNFDGDPVALIKEGIKGRLINEGYIVESKKDKLASNLFFLSGASMIILFILAKLSKVASFRSSPFLHALNETVPILFLIAVIGFPLAIFLANRVKLSSKGIPALAKILGFRQFLSLTEKDKLRLLNAPELKPEIFEKYLPYAVALGVNNEWCEKFESICTQAPLWYEGEMGVRFSTRALRSDLNNFSTTLTNSTSNLNKLSGFAGGRAGGGSGGGRGGSW